MALAEQGGSGGGKRASCRRIPDSLKLALASVLIAALASTDWLIRLHSERATTAAFLLYLIWPVLAVAMLCLTALFAIRDLQVGQRWQAVAALVISVVIVGVTFARFHGWE